MTELSHQLPPHIITSSSVATKSSPQNTNKTDLQTLQYLSDAFDLDTLY